MEDEAQTLAAIARNDDVWEGLLSYGGVKKFGLGKEASLGVMLERFTHQKTIILNMQ